MFEGCYAVAMKLVPGDDWARQINLALLLSTTIVLSLVAVLGTARMSHVESALALAGAAFFGAWSLWMVKRS